MKTAIVLDLPSCRMQRLDLLIMPALLQFTIQLGCAVTSPTSGYGSGGSSKHKIVASSQMLRPLSILGQ